MTNIVLALTGWLVVCWLPGYALTSLLRPGAGSLRNAALAPLPALGLTMLTAQMLQAGGVRIEAATVLPISLGVPLLAWLVIRARRWRVGERGGQGAMGIRLCRLDRRLLGAAVVAGIAIWCLAIPSASAVLPNDDGTHHALYAERILRLGTLDAHQILAGDLATRTPTAHYYPLALHLSTALIANLTGAPVNAVLTVGYVLASAVLLPLGMLVLTRRLLPQLPAAAGVAAIVAAAFPWFPHGVLLWGGVTTIVAMSLVPAGIDAVGYRRGDGRPAAVGVLLGVAGYGLFATHNSELVTVVLFGLILTIAARETRAAVCGVRFRHGLLIAWGVAAVLLLLTTLPHVHQLAAGAAERGEVAGSDNAFSGASTVSVALGIANPLLLVLAGSGLVLVLRRRWCVGWNWCLVATALIAAAAVLPVGIGKAFTFPWYSDILRVSYLFGYFEATYAGVGAVALVLAVARRFDAPIRNSRTPQRIALRATAGVLATLAALVVLPESLSFAQTAYRSSLVGKDQRAAFAWLSSHVPPGGRVLNQFCDGSGWMDVLGDATPLFATVVDRSATPASQKWGDRWYLLTHAAGLATDARAQQAARQWRVGYVYVDGRNFSGHRALLTASALSRSPAYRDVWHRGDVTIFQIVPERAVG